MPHALPTPERMAYRALLARMVTDLPVHPLPMLRACRNTRVMSFAQAAEALSMRPEFLDALLDGADAITFREPGEDPGLAPEYARYIVIYRPEGNPARLRFTLAHELGHRILGHTGHSPREEREADTFASHLLCPQPALERLARRGVLTAEMVSATCYVTCACARQLSQRPRLPDDPLLNAVDRLLGAAADAAEPVVSLPDQHPLTLG